MDDLSRGQRNRFHGSIEPEGKCDPSVAFRDEMLQAVCREVVTALSGWLALIARTPPDVNLIDDAPKEWDIIEGRLNGALSRLRAHPIFSVDSLKNKASCFCQVKAVLGVEDDRVLQLALSVAQEAVRILACDVGIGRAEVACTRLDRPTARYVGLGRVFGLHDGLFALGAWRRSQS